MNNTINISSQNLTLAQARNCLDGNTNGYFQIVSFYVASVSGNRPNATGLTIKFDPRLKVVNDQWGGAFNSRVYTSDGRSVTSRGRSATEGAIDGKNNIFFAATADDKPYTDDGYLYFTTVQFPADVAVGDTFPITVALEDENQHPYEFLFVDSTASAADQTAMNTWTKTNGIINGGFTIVE